MVVLFVDLVGVLEPALEVEIGLQQAVEGPLAGFDFSREGPVSLGHGAGLQPVDLGIQFVSALFLHLLLVDFYFSKLLEVFVYEVLLMVVFVLVLFSMLSSVLPQLLVTELRVIFHLLILVRLHLLLIQLLSV